MIRFGGALVALMALIIALPAFAGVTTGPAGVADTGGWVAGGAEPASLDVSLNVTLNGPTSDKSALPQSDAGYADDLGDWNAKSLLAFSNSAKHGYNWWWGWEWNWNWNQYGHVCSRHCKHRGGGVVPEPGSILLLGMGLSAIALRRRAARK